MDVPLAFVESKADVIQQAYYGMFRLHIRIKMFLSLSVP